MCLCRINNPPIVHRDGLVEKGPTKHTTTKSWARYNVENSHTSFCHLHIAMLIFSTWHQTKIIAIIYLLTIYLGFTGHKKSSQSQSISHQSSFHLLTYLRNALAGLSFALDWTRVDLRSTASSNAILWAKSFDLFCSAVLQHKQEERYKTAVWNVW